MKSLLSFRQTESGIALIELANPPANALSKRALGELHAHLEQIDRDTSIRVLIISARGSIFCAGADIRGTDGNDDAGLPAEEVLASLDRLAALRIPAIAAINGACVGAGVELALCCDIRIASSSATFQCAGVNIGLTASAVRLPQLIGMSRAKMALLTGKRIDAELAAAWGLISELHEPDALASAAIELAEQIASRAPLSVEATKRIADAAIGKDTASGRIIENAEMPRLLRSKDHREALRAFSERRRPVFTRQ